MICPNCLNEEAVAVRDSRMIYDKRMARFRCTDVTCMAGYQDADVRFRRYICNSCGMRIQTVETIIGYKEPGSTKKDYDSIRPEQLKRIRDLWE